MFQATQIKSRKKAILNSESLMNCKFKIHDLKTGKTREIASEKYSLAFASPVFEAMFFGSLEEARTGVAVINDPYINYESFSKFIRCIFLEELELVTIEEAISLLYMAEKYEVPDIKPICESFIDKNLTTTNVCDIWKISQTLNNKALAQQAYSYIQDNALCVLGTKGFLTLSFENLVTILNEESLNIHSEIYLFNALRNYMNENYGFDLSKIQQTIRKIRFLTMTSEQFSNAPMKSNLLTDSEKLSISTILLDKNSVGELPEGFSNNKNMRSRINKSLIRRNAIFRCYDL